MMKSYKISIAQFITLIIIILCGFRFYGYYNLPSGWDKYPIYIMIPILILYTSKQIFSKERDIFFRLMRYLLASWILSMFMSYMFWNQPLPLSYTSTSGYLFFAIFFFFCKKRTPREAIEKIIILFGWIYIALWLYAMYRAPEVTFGWSDDQITNMDRGVLRINFTGRISLIFTYFFYLNKCFLSKNPKYKIFAILFFVFIVLQVTRQLILWVGVVTVIFIFLKQKKLATIIAILFAFLYLGSVNIHFSSDSVLGSMINITNEQMNGELYGGEDPRITEYRYFFNDWSKNIITDIFGNGISHPKTSYGKYEASLMQKDIYLSDVGYPSMYVIVGALGLILYIVLYIKGTLQKLPPELSYVNMFLGFLIPSNIAASWFLNPDTQLATAICIYLIYTYRKRPEAFHLN